MSVPEWKQAFEKQAAWDGRVELYAQVYDPITDEIKNTVSSVVFTSRWTPANTVKELRMMRKFIADVEKAMRGGVDVIIRTNS